MRLIDGWNKAYRFISVQIATAATILAFGYDYIPEIKENLPPGWAKYAILAILISRLIKQGPKNDTN
ncbi:MAG: hypothetical protein V4447_10585 [Pseudomonadota bacterium]